MASLYSDGEVDEYCAVDASPSSRCQDVPLDLCNYGFEQTARVVEQVLAPRPSTELASASYQNSSLPSYLDLGGAAPGSFPLGYDLADRSAVEDAGEKLILPPQRGHHSSS